MGHNRVDSREAEHCCILGCSLAAVGLLLRLGHHKLITFAAK